MTDFWCPNIDVTDLLKVRCMRLALTSRSPLARVDYQYQITCVWIWICPVIGKPAIGSVTPIRRRRCYWRWILSRATVRNFLSVKKQTYNFMLWEPVQLQLRIRRTTSCCTQWLFWSSQDTVTYILYVRCMDKFVLFWRGVEFFSGFHTPKINKIGSFLDRGVRISVMALVMWIACSISSSGVAMLSGALVQQQLVRSGSRYTVERFLLSKIPTVSSKCVRRCSNPHSAYIFSSICTATYLWHRGSGHAGRRYRFTELLQPL